MPKTDESIVDGGIYLGTIDWYVPRYDVRAGDGALVVQLREGITTYFRSFRFFQNDIEYPKNFVENLPNFEQRDVVQFQAQLTSAGSFARNVVYLGSPTNDCLKKQLADQLEKFNSLEWYRLWEEKPKDKTILKLRRRPREETWEKD